MKTILRFVLSGVLCIPATGPTFAQLNPTNRACLAGEQLVGNACRPTTGGGGAVSGPSSRGSGTDNNQGGNNQNDADGPSAGNSGGGAQGGDGSNPGSDGSSGGGNAGGGTGGGAVATGVVERAAEWWRWKRRRQFRGLRITGGASRGAFPHRLAVPGVVYGNPLPCERERLV